MFQRLGSIPCSGWSGGRARSEGGSYQEKGRENCGVQQIFAAREYGSEVAAVVEDELTAVLQMPQVSFSFCKNCNNNEMTESGK